MTGSSEIKEYVSHTSSWQSYHCINLGVFVVLTAINGYQFIILPLLLISNPSNFILKLSVVPLFLVNILLWSAIHEGIHNNLLGSRKWNDWASRVLALQFGSTFEFLRCSHIAHHKFNRTEVERVELYDESKQNPIKVGALYYGQLIGGLYLTELFAPIQFLLPRSALRRLFKTDSVPSTMWGAVVSRMLSRKHVLAKVRMEMLGAALFLSLSLYLYGGNWGVLAVILCARAIFISVHDYAYHYGGAINDLYSARNLSLPSPLSILFLLNFNYHAVHHRWPAQPWVQHKLTFQENGMKFNGSFFRAIVGQFSGPIPTSRLQTPVISEKKAG